MTHISNSIHIPLRPYLSLEEQLIFFQRAPSPYILLNQWDSSLHVRWCKNSALLQSCLRSCFSTIASCIAILFLKTGADGKVLIWHHLHKDICIKGFSSDLSVIKSISLQTAGNQNTPRKTVILLLATWQCDHLSVSLSMVSYYSEKGRNLFLCFHNYW